MQRFRWNTVLVPIAAVLGFVGTIVTLATGIPVISQSVFGRIALIVTGILLSIYLLYLAYTRIIQAYLKAIKRLDQIDELIGLFISSNANRTFQIHVNLDLINLIVATKRISSRPVRVIDMHFLANNSIQIEIDKGFDDGIRDGMQFKVLHKSQLTEIGTCGCTTALRKTTLIVSISPNCPLSQGDILRESIEVRLIEPPDNTKINQLLASVQYMIEVNGK